MFVIRVVTELEEARRVWDLLSPKQNIYEDWDFRFVFYKYFNYPLRFYVGEENGEIIGLLALQENTNVECLEFFGGSFMEDNHTLIKSGFEKYIPEFYEAIKERAKLEDIIYDNEFVPMDFLENKYVIDLRGLNNIEDYLKKTFSSKTRSKLRKKIKRIEAIKFVVVDNRYADIDALMQFNRKNFGVESSFNKPHRQQIYHDLAGSSFKVVMISAEIDEKLEGVSFAIKFENTFVSLNAGVNKTDFEDLGNVMLLKRIEKAINLGCNVYDAGLNDLGWKKQWHLKQIPQYKFYYE